MHLHQLEHLNKLGLTLLHSERPKLYTVLACLSAIGLTLYFGKLSVAKTCKNNNNEKRKKKKRKLIRDPFTGR